MSAAGTVRGYTRRVRLDRYDSYLSTFHATVTARREDAGGAWLALDRSAFYPRSGGQLNDVGELVVAGETRQVVDVIVDAGTVWHRLGQPPSATPVAPGAAVVGRLDRDRRLRHMQRHSAQHLLSAALLRVDASFATVAVSMRGPDCTVEVPAEVTVDRLAAIEAEANGVAREARPITAFEVEEERLAEYALRRPAKVGGLVRLVAIAEYDIVACGGTHLRSTAETLPIKLLGVERVRGGHSRITFRAGQEALEDHVARFEATTRLVRAFSVPVGELPGQAERLQQELAVGRREVEAWRTRLATRLAHDLLSRRSDPSAAAVAVLEEPDAALLPEVMEACQGVEGAVALLAAVVGTEARLAFVAGHGANVDVRPHLAAALAALGGRGGGRPDRAQGAATADAERVRLVLAELAPAVRRG